MTQRLNVNSRIQLDAIRNKVELTAKQASP
jgi:hypothetical protein